MPAHATWKDLLIAIVNSRYFIGLICTLLGIGAANGIDYFGEEDAAPRSDKVLSCPCTTAIVDESKKDILFELRVIRDDIRDLDREMRYK